MGTTDVSENSCCPIFHRDHTDLKELSVHRAQNTMFEIKNAKYLNQESQLFMTGTQTQRTVPADCMIQFERQI